MKLARVTRPTSLAATCIPLPVGADVVKVDAGRRRMFVACYGGAITAIQALGSCQYKKVANAPMEKRVHSLAVYPETGYLYVPKRAGKGRSRFKVVVYGLPGEVHWYLGPVAG